MLNVQSADSGKVPGFLQIRESLPFVFLQGYASFLDQVRGGEWRLFASNDGHVLMPARIFKSRFMKLVQILHAPLEQGVRLTKEHEKEFLDEWIRYIDMEGIADRVVQPPTHVTFKVEPEQTISCGFGSYYLALDEKSESDLFAGMHGKHRNVIRNAEKKGVEIKFGSGELTNFYKLYQNTMKKAGMFCEPLSYFEKLRDCMTEKNLLCGVAYFNNEPQGALVMPFSEFGAYYVYGASSEKIQVNGAMNFLHWLAILYMKEQSVKRYDFVGARLSNVAGTKLGGIQQFKERFGAGLEKGVLWKKDIRIWKCKIYDLLIALSFLIKGISLKGDIIDQELKKMDR
jgi:hypothetical protein